LSESTVLLKNTVRLELISFKKVATPVVELVPSMIEFV